MMAGIRKSIDPETKEMTPVLKRMSSVQKCGWKRVDPKMKNRLPTK